MEKRAQRKPKEYESVWVIFLQDVVLSVTASLFSVLIIRWVSDPIPQFTILVLKWLGVSLIGFGIGAAVSGCSKDVRRYASVRSIAKWVLAITLKEAIFVAAFLLGIIRFQSTAFDILAILCDLFLTGAFLMYIRVLARFLARRESSISERASFKTALVAGTSDVSLKMASELQRNGYDVLGLLSRDRKMAGRVISDHVVFFCKNDEDLAQLQWKLGGVDGVFFPRNIELKNDNEKRLSASAEVNNDGMSNVEHFFKRAFDVVFSGVLLLVFSPVIAVCSVLVRREDGGPALFRQERIGRGGEPFNIYKFRTMCVDAERLNTPALYSGEDDPRLTRIGRFLRSHHLDELPQLWNVLKGDMSFIGYRPERQYYIDKIMDCDARYRFLYQIRPGVTSYATLYNGYTDSLEKMLTRLDLDLYYLRNHSIWFDIKVLGLTFISIVSGKIF